MQFLQDATVDPIILGVRTQRTKNTKVSHLLTVNAELELVLVVEVGLEVDVAYDAGSDPAQLEVDGRQEALAGRREVTGRGMDSTAPNLQNVS